MFSPLCCFAFSSRCALCCSGAHCLVCMYYDVCFVFVCVVFLGFVFFWHVLLILNVLIWRMCLCIGFVSCLCSMCCVVLCVCLLLCLPDASVCVQDVIRVCMFV